MLFHHRAAVWLWVAYSLYAIYGHGKELQLDVNVTDRLRFHAVPVAISALYHDWPNDYTAIKPLALYFQSTPEPLERSIAWAVSYVKKPIDGAYFWAADDRGMANYVAWAFRMFGPHTSSLYDFYFVVMGFSCLVFLLEARTSAGMHALLIFMLGALYCSMPVIPLANISPTVYEPVTLYEPRTIELLSYVATLHLAFAGFVDARWTLRRVVLAGLQAALLALCYQARSSVGWEVVFIIVASLTCGVWRRAWVRELFSGRPPSIPRKAFATPLVPLLLVGMAFSGLFAYERVVYNPRYFQDLGARTVWHNALMGLGANATIGQRYTLGISDADVIDAVLVHMRETADPNLDETWTRQNILNSLGSHFAFNWFQYEKAARALYFDIWRNYPLEMLRCYFIQKPQGILSTFYTVGRSDPMPQRNLHQLYFNPLSAGALFLVLPGFLLVCVTRPRLAPLLGGTTALFAFSLVPGLMFYAVVLTMMGAYVSLALAFYLFLGLLFSLASANAQRGSDRAERGAVAHS